MLYLANPCGPAVLDAMAAGQLGLLDTPYQGKRPQVTAAHQSGVTWAADNGAFTSRWTEDVWWAWLTAALQMDHRATCLFATAPDVVADPAATWERSAPWLPAIRDLGYPAAYVAQNGLTPDTTPWDQLDVLFLGGILDCPTHGPVTQPVGNPQSHRYWCPCGQRAREWKVGPAAAALTADAVRRGVPVHMGRVNSAKRYAYAEAIGCGSVDGTFLTNGPDRRLPELLTWGSQHPALF